MNTLGQTTKSTFLKEVESHKLHEEFEVEGLSHTLTFSAALVTSNTIDGYVGGIAIPQITFASTSDSTMAAIAAAIAALPGVKSASVVQVTSTTSDDRVINIIPIDQVAGIALTGWVVAAGASQATITVATVDKRVYAGMPVELNSTTGKLQPVTVSTTDLTCIGYALHNQVAGGYCTVAMRGIAIIYARSASGMGYVPVKFDSYDATNGYNKVEDGSVTTANQMGWSIDDASTANETIRVVLKG